MAERQTAWDVIVVGLGIMGAACCAALGRRGARVLGLDRSTVPHETASSTGHHRIFRTAYFEHPDYVPLLRHARQGWRVLESGSGETLLHTTPLLTLAPPESPLIRGIQGSAAVHGLDVEVLTGVGMQRRFPHFHLPADYTALVEADAGVLASRRCWSVLLRHARDHGVVLRDGEQVTSWRETAAGVEITTVRQQYQASQLIFTAGPWNAGLLGRHSPPMQITRQAVAHLSLTDSGSELPIWIVDTGAGFYYGLPRPDVAGNRSIKVASHEPGPVVDPDRPDPDGLDIGPDLDQHTLSTALQRFMPSLDFRPQQSRVCLYSMTPDGHFTVGRLPGFERCWIAGGFSGHGFKFAPVIGEAMADLALSGHTTLPIGFLDPARFVTNS